MFDRFDDIDRGGAPRRVDSDEFAALDSEVDTIQGCHGHFTHAILFGQRFGFQNAHVWMVAFKYSEKDSLLRIAILLDGVGREGLSFQNAPG